MARRYTSELTRAIPRATATTREAIGLERWVARLVGAANVREATLFPRDRGRLTP
jgi:hypothetical protein